MRVLLVNNFYYPGGGSEIVYRQTARMLEKRGHSVAFLTTLRAMEKRPDVDGIFCASEGHRRLRPDRFFYKRDVARELEDFIARWKPDIAHLHIFYGALTSAVLPPLRKAGIPSVMSVHEYRMLCPTYLMRDWKGNVCEKCAGGARWHAIPNRCNKGSIAASAAVAAECYVRDRFFDYPDFIDRFAFVSRFCRDIHLKYRPELAPKSDVLYNFTEYASELATPALGSPILYAGRLSREKGLETLLRAFENSSFGALRIAGTGPEKEALKALAGELGVDDRVRFLGHLDRETIRSEIRHSSWVVVSSECYENVSLVVLEAFANGIPVIGADIGGIPELVRSGETGILFQSGSVAALSAALNRAAEVSGKDRQAMGAAGRSFVAEHCSQHVHYEQLMQIYEQARQARVDRGQAAVVRTG